MGVALPNISNKSLQQFKGTTTKLGSNGMSTDYRDFTVSKPGEFNFKISTPNTNIKIVDKLTNKVVAEAKAGSDIGEATAKLGPGTYQAVISQAVRGVKNRDYKMEITERQNVMMLASGATLKGTARPIEGNDSGVQKHTVNVVQGGEFSANLSLPNTRWALMSKEGKVVASGDTMKAENIGQSLAKQPKFKIDPGQYQLVLVQPKDLPAETTYNMTFVPRTADLNTAKVEERPFDKTMREREERLRQWAAQDAKKTTSTKTAPYKMSLLA